MLIGRVASAFTAPPRYSRSGALYFRYLFTEARNESTFTAGAYPKKNPPCGFGHADIKKGDYGVIHIQHFLSHLVQHEPLAYSPGGVLSILGGGSAVGLLLSWRATRGP